MPNGAAEDNAPPGNVADGDIDDDASNGTESSREVPPNRGNARGNNVPVAAGRQNRPAARRQAAGSASSRSGSTSARSPSVRSYNSRGSQADFLEMMRISMIQQTESRAAEAAQRAEDRKVMMDAISAVAQGVAMAFGAGHKRKRTGEEEGDSD